MREMKICRHCGNEIRSDAKKCKYCKQELDIPDTPELFCTRCKAPVNTDDNFCQRCGAIFNIPDFDPPARHNIHEIPYHIGILLKAFAASFAITVIITTGKDISIGGMIAYYVGAFFVSEILLYIYFLPSILAIENNKNNMLVLYIFNLLLGVTVIGWFLALIFALPSENKN